MPKSAGLLCHSDSGKQLQTVLLELGPKRALADPEQRRGRGLVVLGLHERVKNYLALGLGDGALEIQVGRTAANLFGEQRANETLRNLAPCREDRGPLHDVAQLSHVAGPAVSLECSQRLVRNAERT